MTDSIEVNETPVFYAHSREGLPPANWDKLNEHLLRVAKLAGQFAEAFQSREWGYCAGLWHDLGKYQVEFQRKLLGARESVEHSGAGAALAIQKNKSLGEPLAFVIAAHHAGLANPISSEPSAPKPLKERLKENAKVLEKITPMIPAEIADGPMPQLPAFLLAHSGLLPEERFELCRTSEFWTRFLFSALVDADRLDTEEFCDPAKSALRSRFSLIGTLREKLDSFIDKEMAGLTALGKSSQLNLARAHILNACRTAAMLEPGISSLTVPTGGGKTLSGMSFALGHAERWGHRRVIVVIPYTSIIEQNADVYRRALGAENVVEHHSNLDPEKAKRQYGQEFTDRNELACENWDAPIIVTTTVQFFESLFSNHPSRCRKLHNIARSVIILDEVQSLPPGFLLSIVDALNALVTHYGCTVVLSTATPPALAARIGFEKGLHGIREIVANPKELAQKLKRVEYFWPDLQAPAMTWEQLTSNLLDHQQVLAIVHKRDDARNLAQQLYKSDPDTPVFHLSALMCAAHRSAKLAEIKGTRTQGSPCRVVSTQLVEAGVDLDFPIVYRALGGLDSMVQAAGRCNREGRRDKGQVVIFRAESSPPPGTPKQALGVMEAMLQEAGGTLDPADPELFEKYFRMLYFTKDLDMKHIQTLRQEFNFASVGREFRLIEDGFTKSIVVPYEGVAEHLLRLRTEGPRRETLRNLQRFTVNVYPNAFDKLTKAGALEEVTESIFTLSKPYEKYYDKRFGLTIGDELYADPAALMA
ncbi:MAG: CRISPR-associated helicase Cas3' [Acidobacteria bacterium]|nr:CRISPR-associated helicase Cas3' [Acidobacteriota bacterium]